MIDKLKFRLFIYLLKWFCDRTDQWDCLKIKAKAIWYVDIGLEPLRSAEGKESSSYREIE